MDIVTSVKQFLFGKPKSPPPAPAPSLQEQISVLEKRKDHLERLIGIYEQKAKLSKTQDEATRHLKLKVNYSNELKSIYGMIYNLEKLESARQKAEFQKSIVEASKQTTEFIRQNMVNPDHANDIIFETEEAIKEVEQIHNELGKSEPLDSEVQAELDKLMSDVQPVNIPQPPIIIQLPAVPNTNIPQSTKMEDELKALEA